MALRTDSSYRREVFIRKRCCWYVLVYNKILNPFSRTWSIYASINVKSDGRGPRAYAGHLTSIAFPALGNLTKNLGPRVGSFAFFARRNGTIWHCPMCLSVRRLSWNWSSVAKVLKEAVFNRGKQFFFIYTKTLLFTTHFQGGEIWSDLAKFWGPTVGILTKNSSEKSNAPHMPRVFPPLGLNIDRCITISLHCPWSLFKCWKEIDFCINYATRLVQKNLCHFPIQSEVRPKTNCDSHFFPHFISATCNYFEISLAP